MLTEIHLKNFKTFKNSTKFPLSKMNLLTGINGRGKSSFLQSLLLFQQSINFDKNTSQFILNGNLVQLGTFRDLQNVDRGNKELVEIAYFFQKNIADKNIDFSVSFELQANELDDIVADVKTCSIASNVNFRHLQEHLLSNYIEIQLVSEKKYTEQWGTDFLSTVSGNIVQKCMFLDLEVNNQIRQTQDLFKLNRIHYIAADRMGPRNYYEKSQLSNFISLDKEGKNAVNVAYKHRNDTINENLRLSNFGSNLEAQIGAWLGLITDSKNLNIRFGEQTNDYIITMTFDMGKSRNFKPANVGFGYSYILPIIISGLIAKQGEIVIIENPEAHLHPKAQSELTKFLAKVASGGVQVFVESHSEHILNGLRIASLQENIDISNEDLSILYFTNGEKEPFVRLNVEKDGKIKDWVDGFFDQQEQDLAEIFKLGRQQK